jgi:HK97 family phage portal protein
MEAQMAAMGSVGTLFAIVDLLANSVSQVNWRLYQSAASGRKQDRVEITRHLALQVLNKPNPFMPRQEFLEVGAQHFELTGEQWWVIVSDTRMKGIPAELWPIRPDRMTPVPSKDTYLQGYIYTAPDGEKIPLELDQVIFLRRPNPLDPYRGMGPVQSLLADLDATKYSAAWNRNFFLNSAEPGGVIEVDRRLDDAEWDEMVMRWNAQHKGVANAHRVAVIEAGKWVPRAFSQRDMQFTELRTLTRDTIMEAFRVHKAMLGIADDVNRANALVSRIVFSESLQVPRLDRLKGAWNNDYLPKFGKTTTGLELDYDNPVPISAEDDRADVLIRAQAAFAYAQAGYDGTSIVKALNLPDDLKWTGATRAAPAPTIEPADALGAAT